MRRTGSATAQRLRRARRERASVGDENADQKQAARDDPERALRKARQEERILERRVDKDRENDAENRALAAEDRDAAEQHNRDDVQLEPETVVLDGGRELEGVKDPRESADDAREHEQQELGPPDAKAGVERSVLVGPHHEQ